MKHLLRRWIINILYNITHFSYFSTQILPPIFYISANMSDIMTRTFVPVRLPISFILSI